MIMFGKFWVYYLMNCDYVTSYILCGMIGDFLI